LQSAIKDSELNISPLVFHTIYQRCMQQFCLVYTHFKWRASFGILLIKSTYTLQVLPVPYSVIIGRLLNTAAGVQF